MSEHAPPRPVCTVGGTPIAYDYDANGNTLSGGGGANTWDSQNRLRETTYNGTTSTFTYGPDGLRRSSAVTKNSQTTTTHYVLDGQSVVQEMRDTDSDNELESVARYLVGLRGVECRFDDETPSNTRWYIMDGLGSVLAEVDTQGRVNWDDVEEEETPLRKYDVYGSVRNGGDVAASKGNHKFVGSLGHASEADTGLIYMRARYYDAGIGRFISEDPAGDGVNWYLYCENMPVNGADPDGQFFILDDLMAIYEGIAMDAKRGAAAIGMGGAMASKISTVVSDHMWQIYGYMLNAGADQEVVFYVDKGLKGFGWRTAGGAVRVFVHLNKLHGGSGPHLDFQSWCTKTFREALRLLP